MTNEQREAIEICKEKIIESFYDFPNPSSIELKDTDVEAIEIVLSLIKEQEIEIEKKDKQIDLMAESIELQQYANIDTSNLDLVCEKLKCNKKCELVKKDCIKQYFEDKVNSSEQN